MSWQEELATRGHTVLPHVFTPAQVAGAIAAWNEVVRTHAGSEAILASEDGAAHGARNLLELWPSVIGLAREPSLRDSLLEVLGPAAGVVRVLFFDKPPGHSWALPWHKDYNIAVKQHRGGSVFTKPTRKASVPHVMAPLELLSEMVTARLHLDDMTADNGPLRVVPGSHRSYLVEETKTQEQVAIQCRAGDVLLMRPLLTHTSGHSEKENASHRRIVHIECAPSPRLPDGYEWHDFEPLVTA
jgi:hypothetical protein